jgi:hypothetical protein
MQAALKLVCGEKLKVAFLKANAYLDGVQPSGAFHELGVHCVTGFGSV